MFFEAGLILFVVYSFQGSLEEIQGILNTTEISLHQLTALVDCRSLHMVRGGGLLHICPKTPLPLIHADVSAAQFGPVKRIPFFRGRLHLSVEVRLHCFFVGDRACLTPARTNSADWAAGADVAALFSVPSAATIIVTALKPISS